MPNTRVPIGHLFGGISKQPASQRHTNQVSDSRNAVHRINDGTSKRAGTDVIRTVAEFLPGEDFRVHTINRDEIEKYLITYGSNLLRVFKAQDGTECTIEVADDEAADYLFANNAGADDLVLVTQTDTTIIANKTVNMQTTASDDYDFSTVTDWDAIPAAPGGPGDYFFAEGASTSGRPGGYYKRITAELRLASGGINNLELLDDDANDEGINASPGTITAVDYDSEFNIIYSFSDPGASTHRVRKVSPDGTVLWTFDMPGNAVVSGANDLVVDRVTDDIYICGDVNGDTDTQFGTRAQLYALNSDGTTKWGTIAGDPIPFGLVDVPGASTLNSINLVGQTVVVMGANLGGGDSTKVAWQYNTVNGSLVLTHTDSRATAAFIGRGLSIHDHGNLWTFVGDDVGPNSTLLLQKNVTTGIELGTRGIPGNARKVRTADESILPTATSYIMHDVITPGENLFRWVGSDLAGGAEFQATTNDSTDTFDLAFTTNDWYVFCGADATTVDIRRRPVDDVVGETSGSGIDSGNTDSLAGTAYFFQSEPGEVDSKNLIRVPPPGEANAIFNAATMPVQLQRTSINPCSFRLSLIDWTPNFTGTAAVSPTPRIFLGNERIEDLTLFRGRFWILSDDTLYGSQANDLFNLFVTDASNVTDADPVEVFVPSDRVAVGQFVVNFRKSLVVFTKGGEQFEMNNPDVLTPSTAALQPATSYISSTVEPVVLGAQLYFAAAEAEYGQIFEYLFDDLRVTNTAFEITSHVPRLLPRDIKRIAASSNNLTLAILGRNDTKYFVYRMFWSGSDKVQSAWSQWDTDENSRIVDIGIIDNDIYSFIENDNGVYVLERHAITVEAVISGMPSTIHMDRQQVLTGVFNAGEDRTEFDIGFLDDSVDTIVLGPGFGGAAGTNFPTERLDSSTIAAPSDISADTCFVGTGFEYRLDMSQPFLTDEQGNPLLDGELQLFALVTNHKETAIYDVEIVSPGRVKRTHVLQTIVDVPTLLTGTLTSQIQGNSKITTVSITNNSPYPSTVSSAEWIADFIRRR